MSQQSLDLTQTLGTSLTTTTNPDPNTLSTPNPFSSPFVDPMTVSATWAIQTATKCKAMFPLGVKDGRGEIPVKFHAKPSGGAAVTYTLVMWIWDKLTSTWVKPFINPSINYTGEVFDYINNPGNEPIFFQISALSSGTLSLYYSGGVVVAQ